MADGSTGCSGCHPQPPAPPCFAATDRDVVMFTFSLFSCIAAAVWVQLLAACMWVILRSRYVQCFVVKRLNIYYLKILLYKIMGLQGGFVWEKTDDINTFVK